MNFRYSPANIVSGTGVFIAGVAATVLFRHYSYQAADGIPGEYSEVQQFVIDLPIWIPIVGIVVGLIILAVGYFMRALAAQTHFAEMAPYAEEKGWTEFPAPRWVWESRTFPLNGADELEASLAWVGDDRGRWAATMLVTNLAGLKGNEAMSDFQIIGFPFNDDMPRMQVMPEDLVENAYKMVGGKDIDMESSAFNDAWRVRGEDAKRVHDMLHPRTLERLLKADAKGVPVIIDGGAIWTWRANAVHGAELERVMDVLVDVAEAIPAFLFKDLGVQFLKYESGDLHADWVNSRRTAGIAQKDDWDTVEA